MTEDNMAGMAALVIGGAAGIGLASARALAAKGAAVVIADHDGDAAEVAAATVKAEGGSSSWFRADASSPPDIEALFAFVEREHGGLNVLFSNVGTRSANGFDVTPEQFDEAFNLNLKHHFFATNLAVPLLKRRAPRASIIYMSSAAGLRFFGRSPLYAMSKASLLMMARAFAKHLGPDGIRVNALCPGAVDTAFPARGADPEQHRAAVTVWEKQIPLGRIATAEDVANVVAFLASDRSSYLTGLSIPIDGGYFA
jgi:3-oxoacyl-[acyl-carrier protein] reductase